MSKIEYKHLPNRTIAVELPDSISMINYLNQCLRKSKKPTYTIRAGYSLKHPKDLYCKKIGRELSRSRLVDMEFALSEFEYDVHSETFLVTMKCEHFGMNIVVSVKDDARGLRLVDAGRCYEDSDLGL